MQLFYPILYVVHEGLGIPQYKEIFLTLFQIFGYDRIVKDCVFSFDHADAILGGYILARGIQERKASNEASDIDSLSARECVDYAENVRLCFFHFQKRLREFLKDVDAGDGVVEQATSLASELRRVAKSSHSMQDEYFVQAQRKFVDSVKPFDKRDTWLSWWMHSNHGLHWICTFDVGDGQVRRRAHATTNAVESQHRVIKYDFDIVGLPLVRLLQALLDSQNVRDAQYRIALQGARLHDRRKTQPSRSFTDRQHKKLNKRSDVVSVGGDAPRTERELNKALSSSKQKRRRISATTSGFTTELPLMTWKDNSCPVDAFLPLLGLYCDRMTVMRTDTNHAGESTMTRGATLDPRVLRELLVDAVQRYRAVMSINDVDASQHLSSIRDEVRGIFYRPAGLTERQGMLEFSAADRWLRAVCNCLAHTRVDAAGDEGAIEGVHPDVHMSPASTEIGEVRVLSSMIPSRAGEGEVSRISQRMSSSPMMCVEFYVYEGGRLMEHVERYHNVRVPWTIHGHHLIGTIESSGAHFRTRVIVHEGLCTVDIDRKRLKSGVYIADALQNQWERLGPVNIGEDNDARKHLDWFPAFMRGKRRAFYPVFLMYARIE